MLEIHVSCILVIMLINLIYSHNQQKPKIFLTLDELARDNPHHVDENGVKLTPPLFMTDVQHLLMYAVLNVYSSFRPRYSGIYFW